jgi:hypothetical protein
LRPSAFLREPFKHIKNLPASQILPKSGRGDSVQKPALRKISNNIRRKPRLSR